MIADARKRKRRASANLTPMEEFKLRVRFWAAKLRAQPREVVVMRMVRKWASCSRRGRVCFARDLLDQPTGGQDYVIVHELLHLRHANHGRVFQSLLRTHLPRWRAWAETLPPRSSRGRGARLTATIRRQDRRRLQPPSP
jgi:predicted metal-dependent hydrolase